MFVGGKNIKKGHIFFSSAPLVADNAAVDV